ncbi:MAG: cyclic pyranopterin monophosphate synthase MoaC [Chitinophagales bacterium]|nr:cyclic pyranopterin monophosphate synthase MoaC [Chitinophagales bacterium]
MDNLTHIDSNGNPKMVDVSAKNISRRIAKASALIRMKKDILDKLISEDFITKKGPVIQTAVISGTMGAKKTSELIPFCHQIPLESCSIEISRVEYDMLKIICSVSTSSKTGVEMEALMGANIAALTVYDMTKSLSQNTEILELKLIHKTGGKSDFTL